MKTPKKHLTYVWSLITVILSVAIIFVSNLLPVSLLNISALPEGYDDPISLELPDNISYIISNPSENEELPTYFSTKILNYIIEKTPVEQPKKDAEIDKFSYLLENVLANLFFIYTSADLIAQKCITWDVIDEYTTNVEDTIVSVNIVLMDSNNILWIIDAYGNSSELTALSRTPYFSNTFVEQSKDVIENIYNFLYFNSRYIFSPFGVTQKAVIQEMLFDRFEDEKYYYTVYFEDFVFSLSADSFSSGILSIKRME